MYVYFMLILRCNKGEWMLKTNDKEETEERFFIKWKRKKKRKIKERERDWHIGVKILLFFILDQLHLFNSAGLGTTSSCTSIVSSCTSIVNIKNTLHPIYSLKSCTFVTHLLHLWLPTQHTITFGFRCWDRTPSFSHKPFWTNEFCNP